MYACAISRLRRLVLSDQYFFVTCNLRRTRALLQDTDFRMLARIMDVRRRAHGFFLTAWVLLPDHWHAILGSPDDYGRRAFLIGRCGR